MKRRALVALAGGMFAGGQLGALAQPSPVRIGFMYSGSATSAPATRVIGFIKHGLTDNGLVEGRDFILDVRFADGDYERFPALARDLAQAGAKVILASTIPAIKAVQALEPSVPAVITVVLDPVGNGLIDSLARPGRHTTGVGLLNADLTLKLLELQRAVLPKAKVVGVLYNPASQAGLAALKKLQAGAASMDFTVVPFTLRLPRELDDVFVALARKSPDTLQITQDAGILDLSRQITERALNLKLPTFAESSIIPENGGLLSYGPQYQPLFARAAYYAARIVRGANPDDLPVEQPTLFELIVNLRTAKALGLELSPTLLAQASTVID